MKRTLLIATLLASGLIAHAADGPKPASIPIADLKRDTPVDFEKEILPILKNNCMACHNQTKAKADLVLETPQTILKGGENGSAAVPGKSAESLLLKVAARQEKPFMPPKDNKVNAVDLTPEQLALIRLWIDQGAKGEVRAAATVSWLEQPPTLDPIFALAMTQDGQFAAAGRGNRIDVYHVPSGQFVTRLTDPALAGGFTNAAHRDLVNALAFNPDGTLLASAGYREVKLWRRPRNVQRSFSTNAAEAPAPGPASGVMSNAIAALETASGKPATAIAVRPDGKRFAGADSNGVVRLWDAENGKLVAELKGDRYANELVAETERALTIAKADVEFSKKSLEGAESESKKQGERVAKAAETNAATEKIFAEKEKGLKDATAAKAKAEKDLTELLAEIQKITADFEKADQSAKEAASRAKSASTKAAEAKLVAERAALTKVDAGKIADDAAAVAARTKAAGDADLPPEAKAAAQKVAEDAEGVAEKAKSFAEAVAADADTKKKMAADAAAAAEKAIEEVASFSFAAGQLKPAYDKTTAEAPEKRKSATNQVESATKALAAAEGDFKKAETRRSVTGHELELAQQAAARASNSLARAKSNLVSAEAAQKQVESALENAKQAAKAAEQPVRALAFSPDGRTLATAGDERCVHTWSGETGAAFEVFRGHTGAVAAVWFTDGTTLASLGEGQQAIAWDLAPAWKLVQTIGSGGADSPLADRVNAVDFSPDGKTLATASGEPTRSGEVKLWDPREGTLVQSFTNVHSDAVLSIDFSADGKFLASSSADRFVRVVELASGKVVKAFEGHTSYVLGVAWKRDSRTLASAGADKVIKVWDFVTGERKKNIEGAEKEVTAIAFVGATGEAVAASGDNQVRLMRENGEKVRSFEGATEFMNAIAVTPDGQTVVAGGQDGMLHIWDGASGKKVATFAPAR